MTDRRAKRSRARAKIDLREGTQRGLRDLRGELRDMHAELHALRGYEGLKLHLSRTADGDGAPKMVPAFVRHLDNLYSPHLSPAAAWIKLCHKDPDAADAFYRYAVDGARVVAISDDAGRSDDAIYRLINRASRLLCDWTAAPSGAPIAVLDYLFNRLTLMEGQEEACLP